MSRSAFYGTIFIILIGPLRSQMVKLLLPYKWAQKRKTAQNSTDIAKQDRGDFSSHEERPIAVPSPSRLREVHKGACGCSRAHPISELLRSWSWKGSRAHSHHAACFEPGGVRSFNQSLTTCLLSTYYGPGQEKLTVFPITESAIQLRGEETLNQLSHREISN